MSLKKIAWLLMAICLITGIVGYSSSSPQKGQQDVNKQQNRPKIPMQTFNDWNATLTSDVTNTKNPIIQISDALELIGDGVSYERFEKEIDSIVSNDCIFIGKKISKDEVDFLLLFSKFEYAFTMRQVEKSFSMAQKIEKIIEKKQIDLKKLSALSLFGEKSLETSIEIDIPMAYILSNHAGMVLDKIERSMKKYKQNTEEYAMLKWAYGVALMKLSKFELSIPLQVQSYEYFMGNDNETYAAIAANNLAIMYMAIGNKEKAEEYSQKASKTDFSISKCDNALRKIAFVMTKRVEGEKWDAEKKKIFEENRSFILKNTDSDMQLFALYTFSILCHDDNDIEAALCDLEKALMYRSLIWGDCDLPADPSLQGIDCFLNMFRDGLLKEMAKNKQIERFNYWKIKLELAGQKNVAYKTLVSLNPKSAIIPLFVLVSRYENAKQILAIEESKPIAAQDKLLIQKAVSIKKELEQYFEDARGKLSRRDVQTLNSLLVDNFIIHPDSLGQLSHVLPSGVACVQFLLVGDSIIAYMTVKDAPPFVTTISLDSKGMDQKNFIRKLTKIRILLQNKSNVAMTQKELASLHDILFSELEKPLEKLKIDSLVINASGSLRYIPFASLYDGKRYLIEKFQVTNVTGLDLIRLAQNSRERTISNVRAAIFADPDGTLPAGRNEGQNVAQFFANKKLYLGDKASLAEFESMVGNVNFVHLATHAVLDPNEPSKSYIQFADGKKWYYSDMMGFNIQNVDSIALSACETAVSEKSTGGEIEGMAYQLLKKSPSGSVLASFWKVDDTATAMLMGIYYKHVTDSIKTNHTLDRGGALREAQLNLLKNPDTSHPYYWAAFTLFGDFR